MILWILNAFSVAFIFSTLESDWIFPNTDPVDNMSLVACKPSLGDYLKDLSLQQHQCMSTACSIYIAESWESVLCRYVSLEFCWKLRVSPETSTGRTPTWHVCHCGRHGHPHLRKSGGRLHLSHLRQLPHGCHSRQAIALHAHRRHGLSHGLTRLCHGLSHGLSHGLELWCTTATTVHTHHSWHGTACGDGALRQIKCYFLCLSAVFSNIATDMSCHVPLANSSHQNLLGCVGGRNSYVKLLDESIQHDVAGCLSQRNERTIILRRITSQKSENQKTS